MYRTSVRECKIDVLAKILRGNVHLFLNFKEIAEHCMNTFLTTSTATRSKILENRNGK